MGNRLDYAFNLIKQTFVTNLHRIALQSFIYVAVMTITGSK